ncbi:MAG: hypothetical protein CSA62_08770 [Planctomycetota bacterium]|nr:MAG: hypothetical protein CSA62_08770 [Planctomycetota bacterium]
MNTENIQGHVKWFDNRKGFGFLRCDQFDEDIFIHYSNISGEGYKVLEDGQAVCFGVIKGEKGWHAREVQVLQTC